MCVCVCVGGGGGGGVRVCVRACSLFCFQTTLAWCNCDAHEKDQGDTKCHPS